MYIAASALRIISSASRALSPATIEMPMLARVTSSFCSSASGTARASRMRSAVSAASCADSTPSSSTANSSPPKRAAVSLARMLVARRLATSSRTSAPAAWPRLSLIVLKASRSMKMTARPMWLRRARSGARGAGAGAPRVGGAPGGRDGVAHAIGEQRAVGEAGGRIVEGLVLERVLEGLALRDVAAVEHDAADVLVVEQVGVLDLELAHAAVAGAQGALEDGGLARRLRGGIVEEVDEAALVAGRQEAGEARADDLV